MNHSFETLRQLLEKMEVVTVSSAVKKTGLTTDEIIEFVQTDPHLRIFDDQKKQWINENVDGHC